MRYYICCPLPNPKPGLVMVGGSYAAAMVGLCPRGAAIGTGNGAFVIGMKCTNCGHTTINIK